MFVYLLDCRGKRAITTAHFEATDGSWKRRPHIDVHNPAGSKLFWIQPWASKYIYISNPCPHKKQLPRCILFHQLHCLISWFSSKKKIKKIMHFLTCRLNFFWTEDWSWSTWRCRFSVCGHPGCLSSLIQWSLDQTPMSVKLYCWGTIMPHPVILFLISPRSSNNWCCPRSSE